MSLPRTTAPSVLKALSLLLMSAMLASCGGGGRSSSPPPAPLDSDRDSIADTQDCAPTDASRWQLLAFSSVDSDGDTHRANTAGQQCSGASLPATHFANAVAAAEVDCDDAVATRWRLLPYAARDADQDGFSVAQAGEACAGDALPAGYSAAVPTPLDCDDNRADAWRYRVIYRDIDGDGIGAGAGQPTCVGSGTPAGFSLYGYDPLDSATDPTSASVSNDDPSPWLRIVP